MSKHSPIFDQIHPVHREGTQQVYRFANGYGASVVCTPYSYGGKAGLKELAVIRFADAQSENWSLTYETSITTDVEGHLTDAEVDELLDRIAALEPHGGQ